MGPCLEKEISWAYSTLHRERGQRASRGLQHRCLHDSHCKQHHTSKDCSTEIHTGASLKASSHESWPPVHRCVPTTLLLRSQLPHHLIQIEARGLLPDREFLEARQPLCDHGLRRHNDKATLRQPFVVFDRLVAPLERIGAQVERLRNAQVGKLARPDAEALVQLFLEDNLPVPDAQS